MIRWRREPRSFADTIRLFARWGPYLTWGLAALLIATIIFNPIPGSRLQLAGAWSSAIITNIGCGFLIRFLRPRMLANADAWEQMEREDR